MNPARASCLITLALFAGTGLPAAAGELAGVTLPDQVRVDGRTLVLNGLGLREATILKVDVYVAGLYLEKKTSDVDTILRADQPKRLVMRFVRAVSAKDLAKGWDEGFGRTSGPASQALRTRIATFKSTMTDIPNGGTITLSYLPDVGVVVEVQGTTRGTIEGEDFAAALFRIWLGAAPPNPGLKEGLLGKS